MATAEEYEVIWTDGPLGCGLKPRYDMPYVKNISILDSMCEGIRQNTLVGDFLISINGARTEDMGFHNSVDMLRSERKPITLRFRRTIQLPANSSIPSTHTAQVHEVEQQSIPSTESPTTQVKGQEPEPSTSSNSVKCNSQSSEKNIPRKGSSKKNALSSYCDFSGFGYKQGSAFKTWKKRYFVLKDADLIYYEERAPSGRGVNEKSRLKLVNVKPCPNEPNGLLITGEIGGRKMKTRFDSPEIAQEWQKHIRAALKAKAKALYKKALGNEVSMAGWLWKEGQNFKNWKRRYMTLSGNILRYSKTEGGEIQDELPIRTVNITDQRKRKFALDLISDNNRILYIAAESFEEITAWDEAFAQALQTAPCFSDEYANNNAPFLGVEVEEPPICDGWLYKRSQANWKKRYFCLTKDHMLQFRGYPGSEDLKGEGLVRELQIGSKESLCLNVRIESRDGTSDWLNLQGPTSEDVDKWVNVLCNEVLHVDPLQITNIPKHTMAGASQAILAGNKFQQLTKDLSLGKISFGKSESGVSEMSSKFSQQDSSSSLSTITKSGWLNKEGGFVKNWKRRFFTLEGRTLTYYEQINEAPRGSGTVLRTHVNREIANGLIISMTSGRDLKVTAESPEEMKDWLKALLCRGDSFDTVSSSLIHEQSNQSLLSESKNAETEILLLDENVDSIISTGKGWLLKRGRHNYSAWKLRYFVVQDSWLEYYNAIDAKTPLGRGKIVDVMLGTSRPFALDIQFQNGRILAIAMGTQNMLNAWMHVLYEALNYRSILRESGFMRNSNLAERLKHMYAEFDMDEDDDDDASMSLSKLTVEDDEEDLGDPEDDCCGDLSLRKILQEDGSCVIHSGWLRKEGGFMTSIRHRFFTLIGTALFYFTNESGGFLRRYLVRHVKINHSKRRCLTITMNNGRQLIVQADSQQDLDDWIKHLNQGLQDARELTAKNVQ